MSDIKLTLEYLHKDPVELRVFTESLEGLASSYERYLLENAYPHEAIDQKSRLYISQIKSGSIIIDLVDLFPIALAFAQDSNSIIEYSKHLKDVVDWFLGKSDKKVEVDSQTVKDITRFVEPVAKDRAAQFNIKTVSVNGDIHLNFGINTQQGNAIQNQAKRELDLLKIPQQTKYEKVLFYWYQARGDIEVKSGYSGVIESISARPLKVIFEKDEFKTKMLEIEENPFKMVYVVDVTVETVQEKPFAYKITELHNVYHQ